MYGLELIIIIFSTVAQALTSNSPSMDVYVMKILPGPMTFSSLTYTSSAQHRTHHLLESAHGSRHRW